MILRSNSIMKKIFTPLPSFDVKYVDLPTELLRELDSVTRVSRDGLVVSSEGYRSSKKPIEDPTGVECQINRWDIEELVSIHELSISDIAALGFEFLKTLVNKIRASSISANIRVIMSISESCDPPPLYGCCIRFHTLRPDNPWLTEDLEGYVLEGVLVVDWQQ